MTTWFTSDQHFGHTNVIKYCNRPFKDVEEMDNTLIRNWNKVINPQDIVYTLGDFTFRSTKYVQTYLDKLNGKVHFIKGNHDKNYNKLIPSSKLILEGEYKEIKDHNQKYILCHYPFESWNSSHHGSIHLHGHCHGTKGISKEIPGLTGKNRIDVGVDCHNYTPISLEQVKEIIRCSN